MKLILSLLLAALVNSATGTYTTTVDLGGAAEYAILAKSGISTTPGSTIIGNIAVSPIAATAMTGFGLIAGTGFSTSAQLQGKAFAADYAVPTPAVLTAAVIDMLAAYLDASLRTSTDLGRTNLKKGLIGGETLTPGVYTFTTGITISSDIILDGGADEVFIIKTTGILSLATSTKVVLSGGAQAKNVFWQVANYADIGVGAEMQGVILCKTHVVLKTGAHLDGRILAQTAVTLDFVEVTEAKVEATAGPIAGPIDFGDACDYAVVSEAGISTVPNSKIVGNLGVSPIASTALTGFSLVMGVDGQHSTSSQVTGKVYAADYGGPAAAALTLAIGAMHTAYTDVAGRTNSDALRTNVGGGEIGGLTLTPGVYTFTVGILVSTDVTFEGGADDIFILQTTGKLTTAADIHVHLKGGAMARNVIWQVAGDAAIGARACMKGVILCKTKVVFVTGSSLVGAIMAGTAVTLQMATIRAPPGGLCGGAVMEEAPAAVDTKTASFYAMVSDTCIHSAGTSTITGNIAVSNGTDTITGFDLSTDSDGVSTAFEFSGKGYSMDSTDQVKAEVSLAVAEMIDAYNDALDRPNSDYAKIDIGGGAIGGMALSPGLYTFTDESAGVTIDSDLILAGGTGRRLADGGVDGSDDVFILQVSGPLTIGSGVDIILAGGVQAKNVFWQVAGGVTVGANAELQGVLLCDLAVLFDQGSILEGRVLSKGCVTLEADVVIGTVEAFCA
jgi:hypothetical protein